MKSNVLKILAVLLLLVLCTAFCACAEEPSRAEIVEAVKGLTDGQIFVSFPGLGIAPFVINTVVFSIPVGENAIAVTYSVILAVIAAALTLLYAILRSKYTEKIKSDDLFYICIWSLIGGIIGARLLYILTSLDKYKSFSDVFTDGKGLSLIGGLIGGAIALFVVCKLKKCKFLRAADIAASAVMLGQITGRFGDFLGGTSYGYEIGKNDILYFIRMGIAPHTAEGISATAGLPAYVHPAFLYEIVWNIIGFAIINIIYRKKKFDGQILYFYMAWYGFGRMLIEMIRTDSLYIGAIRIGVLLGCLAFVCGVALLILGAERGKKIREAKSDYEKVYTNFETGNPITSKYSEDEENENEDN
ncbi:MAG: prolipoprotein diacylglyceryl transferase [Ruminococcaceae bacterium]|nr:prolipoprotein diacylglyceryl transferase [Oscillospiraceae bacterium]